MLVRRDLSAGFLWAYCEDLSHFAASSPGFGIYYILEPYNSSGAAPDIIFTDRRCGLIDFLFLTRNREEIRDSAHLWKQYLLWLKEYTDKHVLDIWAYCLMPNHVHFICIPQHPDSLARVFNLLHMRYWQYMNKKQGACGHLWPRRFYSCILDEKHLYAAVRYVENSPIRCGIIKRPEEYP